MRANPAGNTHPPTQACTSPPLKKGAGRRAASDGGFAFDLALEERRSRANPPLRAARFAAPFFKGGYLHAGACECRSCDANEEGLAALPSAFAPFGKGGKAGAQRRAGDLLLTLLLEEQDQEQIPRYALRASPPPFSKGATHFRAPFPRRKWRRAPKRPSCSPVPGA